MCLNSKKERLIKAYEYLRYKGIVKGQADVANAIKSSRTNVSSALNGDSRALTNNFLMRFAKAFGDISVDWLLYGTGEMTTTNREIQGGVTETPRLRGISPAKIAESIDFGSSSLNMGEMNHEVTIETLIAKGLSQQQQEYNTIEMLCRSIAKIEDVAHEIQKEKEEIKKIHEQMKEELGEIRDLKATLHDAISSITSLSGHNNTLLIAAER